MKQLKLRDIYSLYKEVKLEAKKACQIVYSNIYQFYSQEAEEIWCDYRRTDSSLLFSYCDAKEVRRLYFVSFDLHELTEELTYFPKGTVLDYVCKGANMLKSVFSDGGFEEIAVYTRKSTNLLTDGKDFKRSYSEMLDAYYDETIGEYATEKDAEEIVQLLDEVFDKDIDHIPSVNEVREYAKKKWVLIYRLSGKIRSLYIYQIQGRKFYSSFSYNSWHAIILYCLEKRAHIDVMRDYDVIIKYSWNNTKNERALKRNNFNFDDMYTYIYKKV